MLSSKYCMRRLVEEAGQARALQSSQASYDELGLDSSAAVNEHLGCALSWFPFCGAVLSGLDDDHISLITPGGEVHVFSE
jgi:hypothetical protein